LRIELEEQRKIDLIKQQQTGLVEIDMFSETAKPIIKPPPKPRPEKAK